jgi:SAM-dependent methyltransferase
MWPTDDNRRAWEERYAPRPGAAERLPEAVRERLPKIEGKHVLHFPCGAGEVAAELIGLGALVTGLDPDEGALTAARERAPDAAFFRAEPDGVPLQLRRSRFTLVYAGPGTLALTRDLQQLVAAAAAALRKGGQLILYDRHPVAACVDPISLRWRDSYFEEGRWRLGQVVVALTGSALALRELEELALQPGEAGGRLDPRLPAAFLLHALKTSASGRSG